MEKGAFGGEGFLRAVRGSRVGPVLFEGWCATRAAAGLAAMAACYAAFVVTAGLDRPAFAGQAVQVTVTVPGNTVPAKPDKAMPQTAVSMPQVDFASLPGWEADDHLAAFKAFVTSCPCVLELAASKKSGKGPTQAPSQALASVCRMAIDLTAGPKKMTGATARAFFESNFRPKRVEQSVSPGMLTGYYEPLIKASRTPGEDYKTPIYKRPADLVNVVAESERGAQSHQLTHMQQTPEGLKPFLTRAEIEQGGLAGKNLELLYFRDPVDVYFLQVQGSGRIELETGETIRITYDGKNGYPYTSIGRELVQAGTFTPDTMSLKALANWLKADRKRAEPVMWKNESYVFFRELKGEEAAGAMGALGTPLHPGRSLAIDTAYHSLGTPIFVAAPEITHATAKPGGFNRLMIAHDVGSAIKGPERGDIFFGSGDKAGRIAGVTKHPGHFFVLEAKVPGAAAFGAAP